MAPAIYSDTSRSIKLSITATMVSKTPHILPFSAKHLVKQNKILHNCEHAHKVYAPDILLFCLWCMYFWSCLHSLLLESGFESWILVLSKGFRHMRLEIISPRGKFGRWPYLDGMIVEIRYINITILIDSCIVGTGKLSCLKWQTAHMKSLRKHRFNIKVNYVSYKGYICYIWACKYMYVLCHTGNSIHRLIHVYNAKSIIPLSILQVYWDCCIIAISS